jgi:hypothetical protein
MNDLGQQLSLPCTYCREIEMLLREHAKQGDTVETQTAPLFLVCLVFLFFSAW